MRTRRVVAWVALAALLVVNIVLVARWMRSRGMPADPPVTLTPAASASPLPDDAREAYLALLRRDDPDRGASWLRDKVAANPRDAVPQALLGAVLASAGKIAEADAAVERAIKLDPSSSLALQAKGDTALARGSLSDALASYQEAVRLATGGAPMDGVLALHRQGTAQLWLGRLDAARATLAEAARRAQAAKSPVLQMIVLEDHGMLAAAEGRPDLAGQRFEQAWRMEPADDRALLRATAFMLQFGQKDQAEKLLRDAMADGMDSVGIQRQLILVLVAQGKKEEARRLAVPFYRTRFNPPETARMWEALH